MSDVRIGEINTLTVSRLHALGGFLDGGKLGEVLLPSRQLPDGCLQGDSVEVFVYKDIDGQWVATTKKPFAVVGEVAFLKVSAVNRTGAFMDWGLPKELLCPFSEQKTPMVEGKRYPVMVFLDEQYRIAASARLDDFIEDENNGVFQPGQEVRLLVICHTPLGFKAVINNSHWGVLYANEIFSPVKIGQSLTGYIKRLRDDGRIDLALQKSGQMRSSVESLAGTMEQAMVSASGFLPLSDKTPPEVIYEQFGVSKKVFKQAIGYLLKQGKIVLDKDGMRLK